jgi:hypothetical protein
MSEDSVSFNEADSNHEISAFLPEEHTAYFQSIEKRHFIRETAVGSLFTEAGSLSDLLEKVVDQRGDLRGDDRDKLIHRGVSEEALLKDCRYLMVNTPGEVGIIPASDLSDETPVRVVQTKPGVPLSLVVEMPTLPETDFGTVIIGPNEQEKPEDPPPSTKEMVWTVHPGPPVRPATVDIWPEGANITVRDVKGELGETTYLKVVKKEPPENPSISESPSITEIE